MSAAASRRPAEAPPAGPVRVQVPATSANVGPGYDSFGLALGIYDEVTAERTEAGLVIDIDGVGAGALPTDSRHLVVRAAAAAFQAMGEPMPGLTLHCTNVIPHGSGQGSSAAAIVAGILAARSLTRSGPQRLPDAAVLALADRLEGHPDNVAPALLGGMTIAWRASSADAAGTATPHQMIGATGASMLDRSAADPDQVAGDATRAVRLEIHPDLRAIVLTATRACPTSAARSALPDRVAHADAAANAARAGLLVHAITADPGLLLEATEDLLHQPYRSAVMPESIALMRRLRRDGIAAVLSGAGPSVLALGTELPEPESLSESGFSARAVTLSAAGAHTEPA